FLMRDWRFAIRASEEAWTKFWAAVPEPGYHDLLAMAKFGHAVIEGDLLPLMQNLRWLQDVLSAPRLDPHGGSNARSPQAPHRSDGATAHAPAEPSIGNGGLEAIT